MFSPRYTPPEKTDLIAFSPAGEKLCEADKGGGETDSVSGDFSVLLNEDMVNFSKPVVFVVDGTEVQMKVTPSSDVLRKTTAERGDPNYQFFAEVSYSDLLNM